MAAFGVVSESERRQLFNQNEGCHIPGYTGHCPTLQFQYGTTFGSKTKEILKELKEKRIISGIQRTPYRYNNENDRNMLRTIPRTKDQTSDPAYQTLNKAPSYIIGYTGFIPTLNFRSGKSFGRTADDCMHEFAAKQRRLAEHRLEYAKIRSLSAPRYTSIRNKDDVKFILKQNSSNIDRFKVRDVSPEFPPIAGYTGYVAKVKGTEESLSQRYNNVVKRSLTLLQEERECRKRSSLEKSRNNNEHAYQSMVFNQSELANNENNAQY